eukprot:6731186-Prymnesium_polylepis.1
MAESSARGATGNLSRSDLPLLMVRANARARMSKATVTVAMEAVDKQRHQLPHWLRDGDSSHTLNAQQVMSLLLQLTVSHEIQKLYDAHTTGGQMKLAEWLTFVRSEQLQGDQGPAVEDTTISLARDAFERAVQADGEDQSMDASLFTLQLLSCENAAVGSTPTVESLNEPLAQHWTAASHKYAGRDRTVRFPATCTQATLCLPSTLRASIPGETAPISWETSSPGRVAPTCTAGFFLQVQTACANIKMRPFDHCPYYADRRRAAVRSRLLGRKE